MTTSSRVSDIEERGARQPPEPTGEQALELPHAGDIERLVRARGAMFLVTDTQGDVTPPGACELGLFDHDTRHLSHYRLRIRGGQIVRLSADPSDRAYNQIDLMVSESDGEFLDDPKNFLHVRRRQLLDEGLVEQIALTNFLTHSIRLEVSIAFGADFADIFEVRGAKRPKRGVRREPRVERDTTLLAYGGLDGSEYTTEIAFVPEPTELTSESARYELSIEPGKSTAIEVRVRTARDRNVRTIPPMPFARRAEKLEGEADEFRADSAKWTCDNGRLQLALTQAGADLRELRVRFGEHTIVGAGIPWFCAPFGRDALLASYEALCFHPELAVESLRTLACFQGKKHDDFSEEEPGKIFHELRFGEMARAKEIPHSPYYGSIDATPLFVVVVDAVHKVKGEVALLRELLPNVLAALAWIDTRSENGTRPVTYQRRTPRGLYNQCWKDSLAGVPFPDGRHAEPPIAVCEVQGYCIDAYARGARVLRAVGDVERAAVYERRSEAMRETFERSFWMPGSGRYAYAIDGHGKLVPTIVSNVGHLLWSRAVPRERAASIAELLVGPPMFGGYGVRTLAREQPVYNPLSYHNGTVWPHDNALVAKGLANYHRDTDALTVFDGLYQAMAFFRDHRLPELFCGIGRESGPVVRYPVAASPQAWSAAATFLLLQAVLGIHPNAPERRLTIRNPRLPREVRRVELRGLRVGDSVVSARFRRVGARCHVDVLDVSGGALRTEIEIE